MRYYPIVEHQVQLLELINRIIVYLWWKSLERLTCFLCGLDRMSTIRNEMWTSQTNLIFFHFSMSQLKIRETQRREDNMLHCLKMSCSIVEVYWVHSLRSHFQDWEVWRSCILCLYPLQSVPEDEAMSHICLSQLYQTFPCETNRERIVFLESFCLRQVPQLMNGHDMLQMSTSKIINGSQTVCMWFLILLHPFVPLEYS